MSAPNSKPIRVEFRVNPRKVKNGLFAIDANRGRFCGLGSEIAAHDEIRAKTGIAFGHRKTDSQGELLLRVNKP